MKAKKEKFAIKINDEFYISAWTEGDPPRTLLIENARLYSSEKSAQRGLSYFKSKYKNRNFSKSKIIKIISNSENQEDI